MELENAIHSHATVTLFAKNRAHLPRLLRIGDILRI